MDLVCRTTQIGDVPALVVSGELDLASIPVLHGAAAKLVADTPGQVVALDLDGLTVVDDAGLGVLLGTAGRAREHGGDLVLVCTNPRLLERFELSGLSRAVEVRARLAP